MRGFAFSFIVAGLVGSAGLSTGLLMRSAGLAMAEPQTRSVQPAVAADACDESVRCVDITKPLR